VELLVVIFLFSVVVNVALLVWLARADNVQVHWPRRLQTMFESTRARPPAGDPPTLRQRSLYVASGPTVDGPVRPRSAPYSAPPVPPPARAPLAGSLRPDLAELLSQPASIAPQAHGSGLTPPGNGTDRDPQPVVSGGGEPMILSRLHAPSPSGLAGLTVDPLTGLDGTVIWSRIIEMENARLLRYRRPATVVVAEVDGLRRLEERLGEEPVDRLLPVVADAFRREARSSDWIARIGHSRFAAFLPETDEIQAINFVERIRLVCEPWLASAAVPLRLAVGWSSPTASSDLEFALQRAEERMHADRRMPGKSIQPPRVAPARVVSMPPVSPRAGDRLDDPEASVPPVETSKSAEWKSPEEPADDPIRPQSAEASGEEGARRSFGAMPASDGRTEV
jgi:diguanylate cyclase (GGDEF)-like protein